MKNFNIFAIVVVVVGGLIGFSKWKSTSGYKKRQRQSYEYVEKQYTTHEAALKRTFEVFANLDIPPVTNAEPVSGNDDKVLGKLLVAMLENQQDSANFKNGRYKLNDSITTNDTNTIRMDDESMAGLASLKTTDFSNSYSPEGNLFQRYKTGKWKNGENYYYDTSGISRAIRRLAAVEYVATVEKTLRVNPVMQGGNFEKGYITGMVRVYRLQTGKLVGEAKVYAENSDEVRETHYVRRGESSGRSVSYGAVLSDLNKKFDNAVRKKLNFGSIY